jgi:hypothetical protein
MCAVHSSDRIDLPCTDSSKSQLNLKLALRHNNVVVVEFIELEVVVLVEDGLAGRAFLG